MDKYLDENFVKSIKPKLIRDKIPDIIVGQNKICTFRKLSDTCEIDKARKTKVLEELEELKQAIIDEDNDSIREELADFIEIFHFWLMYRYETKFLFDIDKDIRRKNKTNGSFNNNYYLEKVEFYKGDNDA